MFRCSKGYRHSNGEVEGFVGFAFQEAFAVTDCIFKVRDKCIELGQEYDEERVIHGPNQCTPAELVTIQADWLLYKNPGEGSPGKVGFFG